MRHELVLAKANKWRETKENILQVNYRNEASRMHKGEQMA
jgi:hypothetical protein